MRDKQFTELAARINNPAKFNEKIGFTLRCMREAAGTNQEQMAGKLHCCRNTVINLESGKLKKNISARWIAKFLTALELQLPPGEFVKRIFQN